MHAEGAVDDIYVRFSGKWRHTFLHKALQKKKDNTLITFFF